MNIQNKRQKAAIQEKIPQNYFKLLQSRARTLKTVRNIIEQREVNSWVCFLQGLFSIFLPHKCQVSAAEAPHDKEICNLITSRTLGHPDPCDFVFLPTTCLSHLYESLTPHIAIKLSPKPPKILRCLPFFNTDLWHVPKLSVSRQVLTILTNLQPVPSCCFCVPQTSFSSVYNPRSQQTQKMQVMHKTQVVALLLKDITKAGKETQVSLLPTEAGP